MILGRRATDTRPHLGGEGPGRGRTAVAAAAESAPALRVWAARAAAGPTGPREGLAGCAGQERGNGLRVVLLLLLARSWVGREAAACLAGRSWAGEGMRLSGPAVKGKARPGRWKERGLGCQGEKGRVWFKGIRPTKEKGVFPFLLK